MIKKDTYIETIDEFPKVKLTISAIKKIRSIVKNCTSEVGFLGFVYNFDSTYVINEIIIPTQEVNVVKCVIDNNFIQEYATKLLSEKNGLEKINKLRFWGHSHVWMDTKPSIQDDEELKKLSTNSNFFIRGIFNKKNDATFDISFPNKGIVIKNIDWDIYENNSEEYDEGIKSELEENIRTIPLRSKSRRNISNIDNFSNIDDFGIYDLQNYHNGE